MMKRKFKPNDTVKVRRRGPGFGQVGKVLEFCEFPRGRGYQVRLRTWPYHMWLLTREVEAKC